MAVFWGDGGDCLDCRQQIFRSKLRTVSNSMTGVFETITFDLKAAEIELNSFKVWLAGKSFVGETEIVAEIAARRQMSCLLGAILGIPPADRIKFELTMKGIFRTDLVLGNSASQIFALIEFEPAERTSVFKRGTAQYRYWGSALEHGFGQIIDWAWVRDDHPNDTILHATFGGPIKKSAFAVVCGRSAGISAGMEQQRFDHRRHLVGIAGHSAQIMTYDEMVQKMDEHLALLKAYIP